MKSILKSIIILLFSIAFLTTSLSAKEGKIIGASNHEIPRWFKDSFLDISEDIEEAKDSNKHFIIFLDFEGCPYCEKMLKENFIEDNQTSKFIKENFDVIELNVKGSKEITWIDGDVLAEKELTEKLKIQYSPTVLIFGENKEIVARVNGYRNPVDFQNILEYVQTKSYNKIDLTTYLSKIDKKDIYSFKDNKMFKSLDDLSKINTPIAIIIEDNSCVQCEYFHNKILTNQEVQEEFSKYTVIRLDANSTKKIVLPDGEKISTKAFVDKINLDYRPAVLLYDNSKLISTIDALLFPFHFKEVLRYVSGKHYIQYPNSYLDYLKVRQDELIKQGIDINVAE
ncbi:thioredoxin family protein [Aliarcobacter lanthieri]|uniref:thioredoxin family protein n=1 Tax=Aliarcobacter lanthieri TaxID=1355374 RepID=UPI00047A9E47|nr:thioredoxin fold domain-containing protein [Aliarcobacter lanthieri]